MIRIPRSTVRPALLLGLSFAFAATPAWAQQHAPGPARSAAPPAVGLDALNDNPLMSELARRNQGKLLEHYFDVNHISPDQRESIKALAGLRTLSDPSFIKRPLAEQQKQIADIVAGLNQILPTVNDPKLLMEYSSLLLTYGTQRPVNLLEYFGEDPKVQAELKPIAEAVVQILDKASGLAAKASDDAYNKGNDRDGDKFDQLHALAQYTEGGATYFQAIALDKSDPHRKEVCDKAESLLKDFDNPDSGIQPEVKLQEGKINLAEAGALGADEDALPNARAAFKFVIDLPPVTPQQGEKPQATEQRKAAQINIQNQARVFAVIAELVDKKPDQAQKNLDELIAWQKANLGSDAKTQAGITSGADILKYRINSLRAELAKNPADKAKSNEQAVATLTNLLKEQPGLKEIVFNLILNRLPDKPNMQQLDPLLLRALMDKATAQVFAPPEQKADPVVLQRGLDAATELLKRGADAAVTETEKLQANLTRAVILQRLATDGPDVDKFENYLQAAEAFMAYHDTVLAAATQPAVATPPPATGPNSPQAKARQALENALYDDFQLRANPTWQANPQVIALNQRVLEAAYAAQMYQYAYPYARLLHDRGRVRQAMEVFSHVPYDPAHPYIGIMAQFYEMLDCQKLTEGETDEHGKTKTLSDADKAQLSQRSQKLATEMNARIDKYLPTAEDRFKGPLQQVRARSVIIAADLAREDHQPQRVLDLLNGFEDSLKALPDGGRDLLGSALFLRINAQMALGKNQDALATLQEFLKTNTGSDALSIIANLLDKIDESFKVALQNKDKPAMMQLAEQRAQLADLLIKQVKPNDPNINKYREFQASVTRQAADLAEDPAKRTELLKQAMTAYQDLQKAAPNDVRLQRYIALVNYDLGNYKEAQQSLGALFNAKAFGSPTIESEDPITHEFTPKPNDLYWEAAYKLSQSNLHLAKDSNNPQLRTDVITFLKNQYILWHDQTGGIAWRDKFEELRNSLPELKDWHGDQTTTNPSATKPATAP